VHLSTAKTIVTMKEYGFSTMISYLETVAASTVHRT